MPEPKSQGNPTTTWIIGVFAVLMVAAVLVAALTQNNPPVPTGIISAAPVAPSVPAISSLEPAIGTVQLGHDDCQYKYIGGQRYVPGEYCFLDYRNGVIGVFPYGDKVHRVFKIDTTATGYNVIYPDSFGHWIRTPASSPEALEVQLSDNSWVTAARYQQLVNQEVQAVQGQAARERAQQDKERGELVVAQFAEKVAKAASIVTAPECVHSDNGCGP